MVALFLFLGLVSPSRWPPLGPVSPEEVRLVLVRHGQAFSNLVPPPILPKDKLDHLTPLGISQVTTLGHILEKVLSPTLLFSSPAERARETSATLLKAMGSAHDYSIAPALAPLPSTHPSLLEECGRRVEEFARQLRAAHAGKTVILVGHAEVIAAFLGAVEGISPEKRWPRPLDNASVTVVDFGLKSHVRLIGWKAEHQEGPHDSSMAK